MGDQRADLWAQAESAQAESAQAEAIRLLGPCQCSAGGGYTGLECPHCLGSAVLEAAILQRTRLEATVAELGEGLSRAMAVIRVIKRWAFRGAALHGGEAGLLLAQLGMAAIESNPKAAGAYAAERGGSARLGLEGERAARELHEAQAGPLERAPGETIQQFAERLVGLPEEEGDGGMYALDLFGVRLLHEGPLLGAVVAREALVEAIVGILGEAGGV